ncbi:MAG: transposase [Sphaerochaeta sp.]|nr:transposase [Sphaerochaeta sp.]
MGDYSVPKDIRDLKPKGTMVKVIKGGYYVYTCTNQKGEDGKWRLKMGGLIGSIKEGVGFIPNDNFCTAEKLTVVEYGQYAIAFEASKGVLEELKAFFNPLDATRIYTLALLYMVNGYTGLKNISVLFGQSSLSVRYPSMSMSNDTLSKLLDALGRREKRPLRYQQHLLDNSNRIAIDGHCIESYSHEKDLAQYGNKYRATGEMQVNLLMAYDIETGQPVLSKLYPGGKLDKTSVKDLMGSFAFTGKLVIVDRLFYSLENLRLFTSNGNHYIIPLSENLLEYKAVKDNLDYKRSFIYRTKKKMHPIFYWEAETAGKDGSRVILYKDMNRSAEEEAAFGKRIGTSKSYTPERLELLKGTFGLFILKTSLSNDTAEEIFCLYKKRWGIQRYYDLVKNRDEFKALCFSDYYMRGGLAFIILITGQIEEAFRSACPKISGKTPDDILRDARGVKIMKKNNIWEAANYSKKLIELFAHFECPIIGDLELVT